MIYTVTLNPSLDYIVSVDDFRTGRTNRTVSELLLPGGKGINVSIVLHELGVESTALGFAAGFTGDEIQRRLEQMQIRTDFIFVSGGVSRINLKLKSIEGTEINGRGPGITREEMDLLLEKLGRLREGDVLFLSGSVPPLLGDDTYADMLSRLDGRGVLAVVDASGKLLTNALAHHPFLIKPNRDELSGIFGVAPGDRESVVPYGRKLQEMGARNVLISLAGDGAVLLAENGEVYGHAAPFGRLVNGVGAGDSMAAGFLAGWLKRRDYEHAFLMGLAAGSASAFSDDLCTGAEVRALYDVLASSIQHCVLPHDAV